MDISHQSNLMIQTQYDTTGWNDLDHGMTTQIIHHPSMSHDHQHHHHFSSHTTSLNQTPPSSSSLSIIYDHKIRTDPVVDQKQEQKERCSDNHEPEEEEEEEEELGAMKEMMYKIAAMQPVDIDPATIQKPKRRNMRISDDPQSVAARRRRERISERIRILQRLVPGGTKMDTATMLDEAIRYVKFLKRHIHKLQSYQIIVSSSFSSSPSSLGGILLVEDSNTGHDHLKDGNYNWQARPNDVLGNSVEPLNLLQELRY